MARDHVVALGPPIPTVPVKNFSRLPFTGQMLRDAWSIVGPSVERNMRGHQLWEVITAAYVEGLSHGAGIANEKREPASATLLPHHC